MRIRPSPSLPPLPVDAGERADALQLGHRTGVVLVGDPASMLMPSPAEAA